MLKVNVHSNKVKFFLTPNSFSGIVATHTAIAAPAIITPANALIKNVAIGYVEPKTAPIRPPTREEQASAGSPK